MRKGNFLILSVILLAIIYVFAVSHIVFATVNYNNTPDTGGGGGGSCTTDSDCSPDVCHNSTHITNYYCADTFCASELESCGTQTHTSNTCSNGILTTKSCTCNKSCVTVSGGPDYCSSCSCTPNHVDSTKSCGTSKCPGAYMSGNNTIIYTYGSMSCNIGCASSSSCDVDCICSPTVHECNSSNLGGKQSLNGRQYVCSAESGEYVWKLVKHPPVASPTANITSGEVPLSVEFSADGYDPDNTYVKYLWVYETPSGVSTEMADSFEYTYEEPGDYHVWVYGIDADGDMTPISEAKQKVLTIHVN